MQIVIRYCGKHYASIQRKERAQYQEMLYNLRQKGNTGMLDANDKQSIHSCIAQLWNMDMSDARKARFLARYTPFKDPDCISKGFFKR